MLQLLILIHRFNTFHYSVSASPNSSLTDAHDDLSMLSDISQNFDLKFEDAASDVITIEPQIFNDMMEVNDSTIEVGESPRFYLLVMSKLQAMTLFNVHLWQCL